MHGLIFADIEGIIGIWDFMNDVENSKTLYTCEIKVYINALLNYGVKKITVCDAHNKGDMILPDIISENVRLVSTVKNLSFDDNYDFAILAGFHGMGESPGILPHTLRFDFRRVYTGGMPIGEVEIYTRWLGSRGVPVILVTGDREAVYEANCYNIYRAVCCVKSLFQRNNVEKKLLYNKLSVAVAGALRLSFDHCISPDIDAISIEFYNLDASRLLAQEGYIVEEGRLIFESCACLVSQLSTLIVWADKINAKYVEENSKFLRDVRELAKTLKREDVENSEAGQLLRKNLLFLDETSRHKIIDILQKLSSITS